MREIIESVRNIGRYSLLAGALAIGIGGCKDSDRPTPDNSPHINHPPIVQIIPDQTVLEGEEFVLDLGNYVSDPESDPLTVELVSRQGTASGDRFRYQDIFDADHDDNVYTVEFLVRDDHGNKTPSSFRLTQKDLNRLPVIKTIQDQILLEGTAMDFDLSPYISDEDGDVLDSEITNGSGKISNNRFNYQDVFDADHVNNPYTIEFKVKDGYGGERKSSFKIIQQDRNLPPLIKSIPDQAVLEGGQIDFDLSPYVSDFEGDVLTAELIGGPGSVANNRYAYNNPIDADHDDNVYTVEFLVRDDHRGKTAGLFKLTQQDVNQLPIVQPIPDQTVHEGDQIDFDLNQYISDPENDNLTARVTSGPGSIANNRYSYNSPIDRNHDNEAYTIEFVVEDDHGGQAKRSFKLIQQDVNQPPTVLLLPQREIWEGTGRVWGFHNYISDPENDPFTIQVISGPGKFGGTLGSLSLGNLDYGYFSEFDADAISDIHTVKILVQDDKGGQTRSSFEVRQNDLTKSSAIKNQQMEEGVVLTSWWYSDYGLMGYDTLDKLYDLGVEDISVLTTWYQSNANSLEIARSGSKTPDDRGLELVLKKLKFIYGMKTKLKPHIDLLDGNWRGNIRHTLDTDWTKWFQEYTDFITHYAKLAERNQVDYLIIGTELDGTTHRPEWRQVISDVRAVYSGKILYSAHWDRYKNVSFSDDLDGVGIGVYFPKSEFATRAQEAKDFAAQLGKKLYVLEVGCQSRVGAGNTPWWSNGVYDEQEQADYYQLAFDNFFNQCGGMEVWHGYHDSTVRLDDFPFIRKKAEQVVRDHYSR